MYKSCSQAKRREYAERVEQVEDGSFTPMVMSSSGGMGPEMSIALKFLAAQIAFKIVYTCMRVEVLTILFGHW